MFIVVLAFVLIVTLVVEMNAIMVVSKLVPSTPAPIILIVLFISASVNNGLADVNVLLPVIIDILIGLDSSKFQCQSLTNQF